MTDGHRFIDPAETAVEGKDACLDAWRRFFDAYPDYRNHFDKLATEGPGIVVVHGRSECSVPELNGQAEWRAIAHDGLIDEWRVSEP